jgi:hypothetical protein
LEETSPDGLKKKAHRAWKEKSPEGLANKKPRRIGEKSPEGLEKNKRVWRQTIGFGENNGLEKKPKGLKNNTIGCGKEKP